MKFRIVQSNLSFPCICVVMVCVIFGCIPTYGKANVMSLNFAVDARGLWVHALDFNS